ncbi:MAG: hypothetical protein JNM63_17190, partial [Spirochaetia bacterium]|nr:hypothetical protein [Spirochaetia bacterium]
MKEKPGAIAGFLGLWLLLLLPTAVHAWGHIPVGPYHVHPGFLAVAIVMVALWFGQKDAGSFFKNFMAYLSQTPFLFFVALALAGLISVGLSAEPKIGVLYWAWTVATVLLLPLTVLQLHRKLGALIFWTIGIYFLVNGMVIFWDLAMSNLGRSHWLIGKVNRDVTLVGPFFRPYAWNFEPSYQAATGLMAALWIRFSLV